MPKVEDADGTEASGTHRGLLPLQEECSKMLECVILL